MSDTNDMVDTLRSFGVIPVVAIDNAADAAPLGEALVSGGLSIAEVTFRTEAASEAIAILAGRGDMLVGAGTVLSIEQADRAIDAGAAFLVSPGINPKVIEHAIGCGVPIFPGVATPTDIELAMSLRLDTLKFFPAEAFGGLPTLKALAAPYRMVKFIPTGGIGATNLMDYLAFDRVVACGGSWMVKSDLIAAGKFERIHQLAYEAVQLVASR